ncbi:hypothetical protein [Methylobacterium sp. E-045]|uniref:hypothetical protein n=1 Tax=Methylobacterium sp. E-045 TaxID=2836575 RepID=UPI001FBBE9A0|nr:hypothetical protein [Methylobacterium sp. E-045]MCJ2127356.1 hypothetical protein [Methylobacterium sp. E-045]
MIKALGGASGVLNNFTAVAPPSVTDDATQGYAVGSIWFMPSTGEMWRARSVTTGAARWVKNDTADHPGYIAGKYYLPFGMGGSVTGAIIAAGLASFGFGSIKQRITISQLGAQVTASSAGGNFQMAVYAHNPLTGMPSALIGSTSSATTAGTNLVNAPLSANIQLEPGQYWFALACDNITAAFLGVGGASTAFAATIGSATGAITNSSSGQLAALTSPITFGTWPTDGSQMAFTPNAARSPMIQFLIASVP